MEFEGNLGIGVADDPVWGLVKIGQESERI